jgi:hypothetical protein
MREIYSEKGKRWNKFMGKEVRKKCPTKDIIAGHF